jgi:hypothetical protein
VGFCDWGQLGISYPMISILINSMDVLTSAPSVASFHAMAAPIPRADPVTRAVLPRRGRAAAPLMFARSAGPIVEACVSVGDGQGLYLTCVIGVCR